MEINYSDKEIIDRMRSERMEVSDSALKYVYKIYYPLIRGVITRNNGEEEDAADIFQEAVIILYNSIKEGSFREDSSIKTYLYAVSRNLWFKELRKPPRQLVDVDDIANHYENTEENAIQVEEKDVLLKKLIAQMGKACREILIDYYYSKSSMKQIKVKFGLGSEQAAKNKKYRCMQRLIELCQQNGLNNY